MSADINAVTLLGRLTEDVTVRPAGTHRVASLRIATNDRRPGSERETTEYHTVIAWDRDADLAAPLRKGRKVLVIGRLQTRGWTDKATGAARRTTEVVAATLEVVGPEPMADEPSMRLPDDDAEPLPVAF